MAESIERQQTSEQVGEVYQDITQRVLNLELSRRTVVTTVASCLTLLFLGACAPRRDPVPFSLALEDKFFDEIAGLPLNEQLIAVENRYSSIALSPDTAKRKVVPLWIEGYVVHAKSSLSKNAILNAFEFRWTPGAEPHGGTSVNPITKKVEAFGFEAGIAKSNVPIPHSITGERPTGISIIRSGVTHEILHFDAEIKDAQFLGRLLVTEPLDIPITRPQAIVTNGFTFTQINEDESKVLYFNNFDENATDVLASYIANKQGLPFALIREYAPRLRDIFEWLELSPDELIRLHRTSDFLGLAIMLGNASAQKKEEKLDERQALSRGFQIIRRFNSNNFAELSEFLSGVQTVLNKPLRFVR